MLKIKENKILCAIAVFILSILLANVIPIQSQEYPPEEVVKIPCGKVIPPDTWNPLIRNWGSGNKYRIAETSMVEYLFYYNIANGTVVPWLATGYESSADYKEYTIYLRKGVEWNDGEPFTADDVVFTLEFLKSHPEVWTETFPGYFNQNLVSAEALDSHTVKIVLKDSDPRLIENLFTVWMIWSTRILPKHIWENHLDDWESFENYPPVFTGPYKLKESTEEVVVVERNEDYWGTKVLGMKPGPKYIIYEYVPTTEAQLLMLERHELSTMAITGPQFEEMREKNPYVIMWRENPPYAIDDPCPRSMHFNMYRGFTSIPEVRKAISLVINRTKLAEIWMPGLTEPAKFPFPMAHYAGLFKNYWFDDLYAEHNYTAFNPEKATRLLESIGCYKKADWRGNLWWHLPNGTQLIVKLLTSGGSRLQAESIYDDLRAFGIGVELVVKESTPWVDALLRMDWEIILTHTCGVVMDPYQGLERYHSKYYRPPGEPAPGWHRVTRYNNSEFDAIVDQLAKMSPTEPGYRDLVKKALSIWLEDYPTCPLITWPVYCAFDTYYWVGWPSEENPYTYPPTWWAHMLFVWLNLKPNPEKPWEVLTEGEGKVAIPVEAVATAVVIIVVAVVVAVAVLRRR